MEVEGHEPNGRDGRSKVEGVLLTGGASTRMGVDKATILVEGESMGDRIAAQLARECELVTILGQNPLPGFQFVKDEGEFQGPLSALARFRPGSELVFVASCDLPWFDAALIPFLRGRLGEAQCAVPVLEGKDQPLCALYRSEAFTSAAALDSLGERRVMRWLAGLRTVKVENVPNPQWIRNVNTPQGLSQRT